ncbi:MAG: hypothetical protein NUV77_01940 [Thermoguttaceae bacterium]|jgi:hypothetical protein|nr:hypothetical protein [Thermoguttaceae bacterium]
MSIPGLYQPLGETPRSGCGCLVVSTLVALVVVSALVGLAIYVCDWMEAGWPQRP